MVFSGNYKVGSFEFTLWGCIWKGDFPYYCLKIRKRCFVWKWHRICLIASHWTSARWSQRSSLTSASTRVNQVGAFTGTMKGVKCTSARLVIPLSECLSLSFPHIQTKKKERGGDQHFVVWFSTFGEEEKSWVLCLFMPLSCTSEPCFPFSSSLLFKFYFLLLFKMLPSDSMI